MGGFHHGSRDNDDSVLLAGGGYKSISDFLLSQDHYKTSPGAGTAGTSSATSGSTLSVPYVTVNANGHVTAYGTHTHTISGFLTAQDHYKTSPGAGTAGTSSATSGSTLAVPYVTINANGHVTGYGTHTHTISGFLTALDHYKTSPGAGTAGTSSATSGSTLSVPYVTVNANGHVTGYGTHTHTITGFAAEHTHPYLPLAGGTMTGAINFTSTNARLAFGALATSPITSYTAPALGSNGVGIYSRYGNSSDEGAIIITEDTAVIYNSSDTGWGFQVHDKDKSTDMTVNYYSSDNSYPNEAGSKSRIFGVRDTGVAYAFGGFLKRGSSDSYVLLGGGGHKAISDFSTTDTNTWRKVLLEGVDKLGTGTGTNPLNIKAGTGMSITESNGTFTFNCTVSGSSDVYWKDVKDKIRGGNEFNIVPSGYNSTMWFNYQSDANTTVTVSEYIFGNGSHSASAAIKSGTVYPGSNASYDIGKTGSRWAWGYFNSGLYIGGTSYTGPHTNAAGTTVASGYIEMNATDPYIDFHRSGYYTLDYSSRLVHWNNRARLSYECYSSTYSGYVATCEGNANNLVIIGVFDLYRSDDTTTTWSLSNICGPCTFSLQQSNSNTDVSFKDDTGSVLSWTISGNVLRVYVNDPSSNAYAWKSTPYAVSCDARVMTRWVNKQPAVTNCMHGDWQGCSVECLCTNKAPGYSLYYDSQLPGKYIYITGARPWGYDDGSNGLAMDQFRQTGNLSYLRVRFVVYGWLE